MGFVLLILILIYILYTKNDTFKFGLQYTRFILVVLNFVGLLPFRVPITGTILILINSFRFWFSILILTFSPPRSPPILVPVLVLIELVSNIARPISLSVRIIANISCRHLLLFLCGNLVLILRSNLNIILDYFSIWFSVLSYLVIL